MSLHKVPCIHQNLVRDFAYFLKYPRKMYGQIYIVTYLCGPALATIWFVIAILFTQLFVIPYKHSTQFKKYWVCHVRRKEEKKLLQSCKPSGVLIEPYGVGRPIMGLIICDDIIHNTVTALLLDSIYLKRS